MKTVRQNLPKKIVRYGFGRYELKNQMPSNLGNYKIEYFSCGYTSTGQEFQYSLSKVRSYGSVSRTNGDKIGLNNGV